MKRKLIIVVCTMLCLTGCNNGNDNRINGTTGSTQGTSNEATTTQAVEKTTSVDTYNKYRELFAKAKDDNDYGKKYEDENGNNSGLTCGTGVLNRPEDLIIYYDGDVISFDIIVKANFNTSAGLHIFINGMPQVYYTSANKEELYVHELPIGKGEEKVYTIYFRPSIGKKGDKLDLLLGHITGAGYRPLGPHDSIKPEQDAGFVLDQYTLIMETDGTGREYMDIEEVNNVEYTEYELSELIYTRPDGNFINRLENMGVATSHSRVVIENDRLRLTGQCRGGGEGEYIVTLFLNGKILKMYRAKLTDYKSRAVIDDTFTFTDEMYSEYDIQDYNVAYFLAIPIDGEVSNGCLAQSSCINIASSLDVLK